MKKISFLLIIGLLLLTCKNQTTTVESSELQYKPISDVVLETAVIYEANIRQYSESGTFTDFTKDIPNLKQLGVKVIWLMPIFPISETKRKATGGEFASLIEDETEREKMLGSYYAVTDFTKVNPEFGTLEDFRALIKTAHENDIYVILDWVANHTGWDHTWLKTNPEYYTQNEAGDVIDPINPDTGESWGWQDVADLNYDNKEMRAEMIEDMLFWITQENIDGFRCDVASAVPLDFWKDAISKLRAEKEIFMLAEAGEANLLVGTELFDMAYGWDRHHVFNEMAKSDDAVNLWKESIKRDTNLYEADDILMTFVTNHDENSWNGTVRERMGDAAELLTALSFVVPGMPLIYSGQEYDLDHRLLFFEKDQIPSTKGVMWPLLEKLGQLKNTNPALNGGKNSATYMDIETTNPKVLAFSREKNKHKVVFVGNFSDKNQSLKNPSIGAFNYDSKINVDDKTLLLEPWGFRILLDNK
ncbi:alpha-amylase family glycosyl hydrolase [Flavobacteriaceae bacterium]|jgi:alpha-amylase|nr:alpha-amylase family glycosyl hydrolase [Flavobacteriaceae bacterium]MDB4183122.1 alpha-amylase family glycosyl hydrolase [Flavobacteriaceae bacterium]MDC0092576.1 alpha-amylase family glycosyl hydrolase [bacterium]MDC0629248.1 alpha-amylase family glycosyl hydrolase [Flavobacteriaceae bacterium]